MASRPSKRQKRLVILSSEDDEKSTVLEKQPRTKDNSKAKNQSVQINSENNGSINALPTRPRLQARSTSLRSRSSTTIPEGPYLASRNSTKKKSGSENDGKSRSLHAFFSDTNLGEQSQAKIKDREDVPESDIELDDIIEDDSQDDDFPEFSSSQHEIRSVLDRRKRHLVPTQSRAVSTRGNKFPVASQKFLVHRKQGEAPFKQATDSLSQVDQRPWAEKYGPTNVEELAIHKRKLIDVRVWLEKAWLGRDQKVWVSPGLNKRRMLTDSKRLLVLKGPSGAGKTAAVFGLCNAMGIDVSEWKNPATTDFSSESYISLASQFDDFLGRSGKFSNLEFINTSLDHSSALSMVEVQSDFSRKKVILVEEFPNIFTSTSTALKSFRSSIIKHLAASRPLMRTSSVSSTQDDLTENFSPVVMIMTEAHFTSTNASHDTFSAHRLLGPEILNHPSVSVIEFNPIAPTYITKALDLVIKKEARQSGRRRIPGPSVIKKLGETGDIRSAIGSLEFLCLRGEDWDDWGGSVAGRAKRGANSSSVLTKMEKETLEMVTRRETSLGIFHAVGKVVYNKRDEVEVTNPVQELSTEVSSQLPHQIKLQISQVSLNQLIDESGTDTGTFIAALHENYVMSCQGLCFTESLNGCIDALSDSDLLSSDRRGRFNSGFSSGGFGRSTYQGDSASDILRQDDICFHVATRGILFALPYPVQRRAAPTGIEGRNGGKRDAFKMFYPASLKLSRKMEEVESSIDQWASRYSTGLSLLGSSTTTKPPSSRQQPTSSPLTNQPSPPPPTSTSSPPPPLTTTNLKTNLLLDTLPYITAIERAKNPSSPPLAALESITKFSKASSLDNNPSANSEEDEADDRGDKKGKNAMKGDASREKASSSSSALGGLAMVESRLWLSEDDIED